VYTCIYINRFLLFLNIYFLIIYIVPNKIKKYTLDIPKMHFKIF